MTKLLARTTIANSDFTDDCAVHIAKPGSPSTSWKGTWGQIKTLISKTGKTIFVDATYGNDSTGAYESWAYSFQTIAGAQAIASSGDQIVILPGTYTDTLLGADGINYHYQLGAKLFGSSYLYIDGGTPMSYSITGDGYFSSSGAEAFSFAAASEIYIECLYAEHSNNGHLFYLGGSGATIVVDCKTDLKVLSTGYPAQVIRMNDSNNLFIKCKRMMGAGMIQTDGVDSVVILQADQFIWDTLGSGGAAAYNALNHQSGSLTMIGDFYANIDSNYSIPAIWCSGDAKLKWYGDHYILSQTGFFWQTSTGRTDFYGKVNASGASVTAYPGHITYIGAGTVKFHDEIVSNYPAEGVIYHGGGKTIVESIVKNLDTDASSHGIVVIDAGLILKQRTAISLAGAADSVNAATAKTIKTYPGAVANTAVNVNITEQVSTLLIDTNVDTE